MEDFRQLNYDFLQVWIFTLPVKELLPFKNWETV